MWRGFVGCEAVYALGRDSGGVGEPVVVAFGRCGDAEGGDDDWEDEESGGEGMHVGGR